MNNEEFISYLKELNVEISQQKLDLLEKYYNLLVEKNKTTNLTRITEKDEVYLKHFYDSLTITKEIDLNKVEKLCDVGTGAGFPGIVLKIFYPHLNIVLIDAREKKIKFLQDVIKELGLKDIEALHIRAEEYHEKFDIVTARAVANIEKLLDYTMHLLNKNGKLVAMKGDIDQELPKEVEERINKKYKITKINKFVLPKENSKRALVIIENK